jgi:TonB family protein
MNSPALKKSWEGQVVGEFPLRQWLGGSDHSAVFLTEFSSQKAAIKLVPANTTNVDQPARWRPAMKFSHPHLLRVFDMGRCEIDGAQYHYLVTEFAEEDLSQILPQRSLTPAETAEFLTPVLDTLWYLHSKGYVHGGLKPSNILATDNHLKLSADRLQPIGQSAARGRAATIFDAPELAIGTVSPAADIWSLGATLVEALTQHTPTAIAGQDPVVPNAVPEPYRAIARSSLRRDPQQRASLAKIQGSLRPGSMPAVEVPRPRTERKAPKWRLIVAAAAVVIVIALLLAVVALVPRPGSSLHTGAVSTQTPMEKQTPAAPRPPTESKPATQKPAINSQSAAPASSQPQPEGSVAQQVLPDISRSARNTIHGKIKITAKVIVDSTGKVTSASLTSPGPSSYFANLALKASQQWRFTPAKIDAQPVASTWLLHYRISRAATEVTPEPLTKH